MFCLFVLYDHWNDVLIFLWTGPREAAAAGHVGIRGSRKADDLEAQDGCAAIDVVLSGGGGGGGAWVGVGVGVSSRNCVANHAPHGHVTECGHGFTKKLEGMFADIEIAKDMMQQFKASMGHCDVVQVHSILLEFCFIRLI